MIATRPSTRPRTARTPAALVTSATFAAVIGAAVLPGCAASGTRYDDADRPFWSGHPERLEESYAESLIDDGRDALVGRMKILSARLLANDWERALPLAEDVSTQVNVYLAGQRGERDALSTFGAEREKPFKGEPHEQAMADLYLGLLRYRLDDPEGALACFRSARNKDRGTFLQRGARSPGGESETRYLYEADWATLEILIARAWQLIGEADEATQAYRRAAALRPGEIALFQGFLDDAENVRIIIETGAAPTKRGTGPERAILGYREGPRQRVTSVRLDGRPLLAAQLDSLYDQATTLGGRQVDELNARKAQTREGVRTAGEVALGGGALFALAAPSREGRAAGLLAMLGGVATMIAAEEAIDPVADTRAWSTLPGALSLAVGRAAPGPRHLLEVTVEDRSGPLTVRYEDVALGESENFIWLRILPDESELAPAPAVPERPDRDDRTHPRW